MGGALTRMLGRGSGGATGNLNLDFLTATYVGATPTCTRASSGYAETLAGALTSFGTDTLRATDKGLLVEPAATNQVYPSEDFSTTWVLDFLTVTADNDTGPNGSATADKFTATHTGVSQAAKLMLVGSNATTTHSIYVKPGTAPWCYIQVNDEPLGNAVAKYFDLSGAGAVGSTQHLIAGFTVVTATIAAAANGYYLISVTVTSTASKTGQYIYVGPCDADNSRTVTNGLTMYAWGAQVEINSTFTSRILTTSGTVVRAADQVDFTIPGGVSTLVYTFDDNSTQSVGVSPGAYTIPTNLNRRYIKTVVG